MNQHQVDVVELELREILADRRVRVLFGLDLGDDEDRRRRSKPQARIASPMPRCV